MSNQKLKENTLLFDRYFPFNIFHNTPSARDILYLHWHKHIEIIYMTSGHGIFNIGTKMIEAFPGDLLIVNPGELHSGYSVDNTIVNFYAIVFDASLLANQLPDSFYHQYLVPVVEGKLVLPSGISTDSPAYAPFRNLVESILEEFSHGKAGSQSAIHALLTLFFVYLQRDYGITALKKGNSNANEEMVARFKELIKYIEENYHRKILIEQAAKLVNMSPYYFCKLFKKTTGKTFIEYLNLYRINRAEELLQTTELPVSLVAEKVGFCNINYFDRVFKLFKRYPPSKCRKKEVYTNSDGT